MGDDRTKNISPAVSTVNVAVAQGTVLKHAELFKPKVRVIAGTIGMSVLNHTFLISVGGDNGAAHVQQDILQRIAVMVSVSIINVLKACQTPKH